MAHFTLECVLNQGSFVLDVRTSVDARALALFGPSGSGKTSLIETIAGLRTPASGRIAVNGRVLFDSAAHIDVPARLRRVGYVPQDVLLFPHLNVRANVLYGMHSGDRFALDALVELLELAPLMNRRVQSLSGGERQRVALARALYSVPDVLLLDEPLAAVDVPRRRRIVDALLRIRDGLGVPFVYVTHSREETLAIADHALVLDGGRLVAGGAPGQVVP